MLCGSSKYVCGTHMTSQVLIRRFECLQALDPIQEIVLVYGQANKRIRWMPWQLEAMKDVGACEKLRGVGNQTVNRRCPNGETHWRKPVSLT